MDGKAELPRTLSWEILHAADPVTRAGELARECADPNGVLSALSGGLPYPIAGRVHAAISASSAIERVKILFDVLEGTWRFIATVLLSAYFAPPHRPQRDRPPGFEQISSSSGSAKARATASPSARGASSRASRREASRTAAIPSARWPRTS